MPAVISRPDTPPAPTTGRTVAGVLLITFGLQAILRTAFGLHLTLWVFVLGALVLQRWFVGRSHGALVAGGLLVGVGLGEMVQDLIPGRRLDDVPGWLGWSFGFLLIASLGGRATRWAYVGAIACGVGALGALGLALGQLVPHWAASFSFPLFVLLAGVLLLSRGSGRGRLVLALLAVGVLLFASSVSDSYREVRDGGPPRTTRLRLPSLDGRTLVIRADGDVTVRQASGRRGHGSASVVGGRQVTAERDDGVVVLDDPAVRSYELFVPRDTALEVHARNGAISVEGEFGPVVLTADNGEIDAELEFDDAGDRADLEADNGSVRLRYTGRPEFDVDADNGEITLVDVDGREAREGQGYGTDGPDGEVTIEADNGSVRLVRVRAAGRS